MSADTKPNHSCTDFKQVFYRHYHAVCRLVTGVLGDQNISEDIAQEAFIKLFRNPPRELSSVRGWLNKVAINLAYDHLRKEKSRLQREAGYEPQAGTPGPADRIVLAEEAGLVRAVLQALPERDRICLVLKNSGASYAEIAQAIQVHESSVGTILARARSRFKTEYIKLKGSEDSVL